MDLLDSTGLELAAPTVARAPSGQFQSLASASSSRAERAEKALDLLGDLFDRKAEIDRDALRGIVREEIESHVSITRIEVKNRSQKLVALEGHFHPMFPILCQMASAFGNDGYVPGIFIYGERSSGKSTACRMLAKALSLPFHYNGAISMPHEMLGFIDGAGVYHRTPFREAYEHGGVYCFDEVARSEPSALLPVNPHLADPLAEFPDGQITRHPDCVIIAADNTLGLGGNASYVTAVRQDLAFLSRFPGKLEWNIDEEFERQIVRNPVWCARVQAARQMAKAAGIGNANCDVRANQAGAAYIEAGMSHDMAAKLTIFAGLKPEQIKMIEPGFVS